MYDEGHSTSTNSRLHSANGEDSGSESEEEESMYGFGGGMCGFSASQCDELLMQGVKPWDDDALDVMAALESDYY